MTERDHAMRTREGSLTLFAELDKDITELDRPGVLNQRAWDRFAARATDALDLAALE